MAKKKNIQENLIDKSEDEPIALAADAYVQLLDERDQMKEELETAQNKLILEMNKKMKYIIHHRGRIIEIINTNPKQKIKVKDERKN